MEGLIAVAVVVLLVGKKEVAFEPGSPLPELPDAEGERLLALGAVKGSQPQRKPSGRKAKDGAPEGGKQPPAGGEGQGGEGAGGQGGPGEGDGKPPDGATGGGTPTP